MKERRRNHPAFNGNKSSITVDRIPDMINISGTTVSGVSYNRAFLYAGFKRSYIVSRGQDTH